MVWGEPTSKTELSQGMLTPSNHNRLSIGKRVYERLCEGYGTNFCLDCCYAGLIPEVCPAITSLGHEHIICGTCNCVCPCNRTLNYATVKLDILRYEIKRIDI